MSPKVLIHRNRNSFLLNFNSLSNMWQLLTGHMLSRRNEWERIIPELHPGHNTSNFSLSRILHSKFWILSGPISPLVIEVKRKHACELLAAPDSCLETFKWDRCWNNFLKEIILSEIKNYFFMFQAFLRRVLNGWS